MLTSSKIFLKKSNPQTYAKGTRHRGCPRAMPRTAPGGCGFRGAATGLRRILQLPQGDVALRHAGALEHQKLAQSGAVHKSSTNHQNSSNTVETSLKPNLSEFGMIFQTREKRVLGETQRHRPIDPLLNGISDSTGLDMEWHRYF